MKTIATVVLSAFFIYLLPALAFGATMVSPAEDQQVEAGSWITIIVKPDPGEEWENFVVGFEPLEYDPNSQTYKHSIQVPEDELGYRNDLRVYGLDKAGNEVWLTRRIFVKLPSNVVLQGIEAGDAGSDFISLRKMPEGSSAIDVEHFATRQITTYGRYSDGVNRELTSSSSGTTYASSDETIVKVDTEGKVTAQGIGRAKITVKNGNYSAIVDVIVKSYKK